MQEFLENNSLYVVLGIVLMIWTGIIVFFITVDKRLKKLEIKINSENTEKFN
ncbi:MAG: CcmD family protein [Candidatus Kapabacteria bacterium]|nr:CcmD family protein [Candidatus Kapabacteria bacterium]